MMASKSTVRSVRSVRSVCSGTAGNRARVRPHSVTLVDRMDVPRDVGEGTIPGSTASAWLSVQELAALLESDAARARRCLDLWLAPAERDTLAHLSVPKRRREWLAGRVAAKELVRRRHRLAGDDALRRIEIAAPQAGPSKGKPFYRIDDTPGGFDLSISHSGDCAVAALASTPHEHIGIDVEQIQARDASFEALALSDPERALIARLEGEDRAVAVTERWVLKEALSKALGTGLRLRFQRVTVHVDGRGHGGTPSVRFDAPGLHDSPNTGIRGKIRARLARVGGLCVASVTIQPVATSP
jgi:phosphopantetheinyl transferase